MRVCRHVCCVFVCVRERECAFIDKREREGGRVYVCESKRERERDRYLGSGGRKL